MGSGQAVDYASGAIAQYAGDHGFAALSVLTVSQNLITGERIGEHERQSRFNAAARIVFETLLMDCHHRKKEETK